MAVKEKLLPRFSSFVTVQARILQSVLNAASEPVQYCQVRRRNVGSNVHTTRFFLYERLRFLVESDFCTCRLIKVLNFLCESTKGVSRGLCLFLKKKKKNFFANKRLCQTTNDGLFEKKEK